MLKTVVINTAKSHFLLFQMSVYTSKLIDYPSIVSCFFT